MIQQEQQNAQRLEELAQRERQAVQMIQSVLQGHQTAIQRLQQAAQICSQLEQTWRAQALQVNYQQPAYQPSYSHQVSYSTAPYRQ
jgi:type II secretory pathway pseudopilin PulG